MPADDKSVFSSTSRSTALEPLFKPKAIDYLKTGRENKETSK